MQSLTCFTPRRFRSSNSHRWPTRRAARDIKLRTTQSLSRRYNKARSSWSELAEEIKLRRQACIPSEPITNRGGTSKRAVPAARIRTGKRLGAHFRAGREAVRMFLRGSFPCVFFLAINVDRPGQCAELLRNLQAVYRRFCQEQGLARAFCANSALYAKPANTLSSKVLREVVDLASGDVVQLVRTLPHQSISSISLLFSSACRIN